MDEYRDDRMVMVRGMRIRMVRMMMRVMIVRNMITIEMRCTMRRKDTYKCEGLSTSMSKSVYISATVRLRTRRDSGHRGARKIESKNRNSLYEACTKRGYIIYDFISITLSKRHSFNNRNCNII